MSRPSDHLQFQFDELNEIKRALNVLDRLGFGPLDKAYAALYRAQGAALGKLGLAKPRMTTFLKVLPGLSPGKLNLFLDAELGWLVELTAEPGSVPIRKYVGDDIAEKILLEQLDHDDFMALLEPEEEYIA